MKTNRSITNPFIRALLARELWGYHESHVKTVRAGYSDGYTQTAYEGRILAACNMAARVNLWLDRDALSILLGNVEPLEGYKFFGGHNA